MARVLGLLATSGLTLLALGVLTWAIAQFDSPSPASAAPARQANNVTVLVGGPDDWARQHGRLDAGP